MLASVLTPWGAIPDDVHADQMLPFHTIADPNLLGAVDLADPRRFIGLQGPERDDFHGRIVCGNLAPFKMWRFVGKHSGRKVDYSIMEYSSHHLRGFPVEFVALGFLVETPLHGYALRARIAEGLGPLWQVASSQLYQVLHRLEERGDVRRTNGTSSGGPSRQVYCVTESGRRSFWEWALTPVDAMRNVRVEFAAKIYFIRRLRPDAVVTLVERQMEAQERMEAYVSSESRPGSDDAALNEAWTAFQVSTVANFTRWLKRNRDRLSIGKEHSP